MASGTLTPFDPFDQTFVRSPWATYRWLRDEAPLLHVESIEGRREYWVLSRFTDVMAAARDAATFSSASGLTFTGDDIEMLGLAPTIVMMDPPLHTAYRRLVNRGFTPRSVTALEPAIRDFVRAKLDGISQELAGTGTTDFIAGLASPLPSFVVATYLGVPEEDRHHFDEWSTAIVAANAYGNVLTDAQLAVGELYGYFTALMEKRRAVPQDDMISLLVHVQLDGESLTAESILGYAFVMIAGGNDTVTGLLGGTAELLTNDRAARQELIEHPEILTNALEEFLRLTSPVQGLSRTTTREVSLHGQVIPAGSKVHLLYGSANRDPREFGDDAEDLDIHRSIDRIMSFTSGPHHCLGASAARLQARIALEELLRRFPDFSVNAEIGRYAPGAFVRRFEYLPFFADAPTGVSS